MHRDPGFTLIELLVIISIIAILLSIVAPTLEMALLRVDVITCKSNLHHIGIGLSNYQSSHGNRFMPFRHWIRGDDYRDLNGLHTGLIYPYVQNDDFFLCPTFREACDPTAVRTYVMTWNFGCTETYWWNLGNWGEGKSIDTILQVKDPSRLGIVTEEATYKIPGYSTFTMNDAHLVAPDWPNRDTMANFHYPGPGDLPQQIEGVANVVFVDGHVDQNTTEKTPYVLTQKWY